MDRSKRFVLAVGLLFFVSGLCGLVYEVVWMRLLGLVIGSTVYAMATVLTAFMGGLALGSYAAGKAARRLRRPVFAYGVLELLIAGYCLILPALIRAAEPLLGEIYRSCFGSFFVFSLWRFLICGALLVVPTTLMGATLPVLAQYVGASTGDVGRTVGGLYAANTFGAVAGALAAGFVLMPALGMTRTIRAAAGLGAAAGLAACALPVRPADAEAAPAAEDQPARLRRLYIAAVAVSGFCGMALQIAWTRVLALSFGGSAYTYSLILAGFILGLALGGAAFGRWAGRMRRGVWALGLTQSGIGVAALLTAPALGKLPVLMSDLTARYGGAFGHMMLLSFGFTLAALFAPAFLMGGMLPLAARLTIPDARRCGSGLGRLYAWNTLGAIAGSFCGGFVLMRLLGVQGAVYVAAGANMLMGCVVTASDAGLARLTRVLLPACGLGLAGMLAYRLPRWDAAVMASGPYLYGRNVRRIAEGLHMSTEQAIKSGVETLFYKDGPAASVSVFRIVHGDKFLRVNGKTDASTGGDMITQLLIAHVSMMLHPNPRRVLVIGLGSGITTGAVLQHDVERVESLELCPAVAEAARRCFSKENHRCLDDPRHVLRVVDARSHVALSRRRYDVIISEPSNPWIAGEANLFTREFFQDCFERLAPGGVMCSWIHAYSLAPDDFKMVIKTFREVFPQCSLWYAQEGDYLMAAAKGELAIRPERMLRAWRRPGVRSGLASVDVRSVEDLLAFLLFGPEQMERFSRGAGVNTDDGAQLEYSAPRSLLRAHAPAPYAEALSGRGWPVRVEWSAERSARALRARRLVLRIRMARRSRRYAEARAAIDQLLRIDPQNAQARASLAALLTRDADRLLAAGRPEAAARALQRAVEVKPDSVRALKRLAQALELAGRPAEAIAACRRALLLKPEEGVARLSLARLLLAAGRPRRALEQAERVLDLYPHYADACFTKGLALAALGRPEEAAVLWERALELWPGHREARAQLAKLRARRAGGSTR